MLWNFLVCNVLLFIPLCRMHCLSYLYCCPLMIRSGWAVTSHIKQSDNIIAHMCVFSYWFPELCIVSETFFPCPLTSRLEEFQRAAFQRMEGSLIVCMFVCGRFASEAALLPAPCCDMFAGGNSHWTYSFRAFHVISCRKHKSVTANVFQTW